VLRPSRSQHQEDKHRLGCNHGGEGPAILAAVAAAANQPSGEEEHVACYKRLETAKKAIIENAQRAGVAGPWPGEDDHWVDMPQTPIPAGPVTPRAKAYINELFLHSVDVARGVDAKSKAKHLKFLDSFLRRNSIRSAWVKLRIALAV